MNITVDNNISMEYKYICTKNKLVQKVDTSYGLTYINEFVPCKIKIWLALYYILFSSCVVNAEIFFPSLCLTS